MSAVASVICFYGMLDTQIYLSWLKLLRDRSDANANKAQTNEVIAVAKVS